MENQTPTKNASKIYLPEYVGIGIACNLTGLTPYLTRQFFKQHEVRFKIIGKRVHWYAADIIALLDKEAAKKGGLANE